jgi:hypothetical protein
MRGYIFFFNCFLWIYQDLMTGCGLNKLTRVDSSFFCLIFLFYFLFNHSTLSWLKNELCNFFKIFLYRIISISWLGSQVWQIDLSWLREFFLSFLIGLYNLLSVDLFWSHDSSCRFDRLAQNNLVHFFGFFLLNIFFFNSSFNIRLFRN